MIKASISQRRRVRFDRRRSLLGISAWSASILCAVATARAGPLHGSFTAKFKARVGGGTEQPAQGFSFVFAGDLPTDGTTTFREGGGASLGLVISFDTVDN